MAAATATLVAGTIINRVAVNVVTAFAVAGQTITTFTLSVGDGGGTTRYASGVDLKTTGWKATTLAGNQYLVADTIDAIATFTLSAHTAAELTAGQVEIYYDEVDPNGLAVIGQP